MAQQCSPWHECSMYLDFFFSDELYSIAGFPLRIQWVLHQHPSYQDIQKGGRNQERQLAGYPKILPDIEKIWFAG